MGEGGCEGFYLLLPLPYTQWPLVPGNSLLPSKLTVVACFLPCAASSFLSLYHIAVYGEKVNLGLLEVSVHSHWPCCLWLCAETAVLRGVGTHYTFREWKRKRGSSPQPPWKAHLQWSKNFELGLSPISFCSPRNNIALNIHMLMHGSLVSGTGVVLQTEATSQSGRHGVFPSKANSSTGVSI